MEAAHTHHHAHTHPHTQTKAVLNRMARLIGHMQSVRRMVEDGRDCSEVLLQLSAVDAALKNVGKIILKDHMEHCIIDAVQNDDGCISMEVLVDPSVPGRVLYLSHFTDEAAFRKHAEGETFRKWLPELGKYFISAKDTILEAAE